MNLSAYFTAMVFSALAGIAFGSWQHSHDAGLFVWFVCVIAVRIADSAIKEQP